jgi:hypothetical protein
VGLVVGVLSEISLLSPVCGLLMLPITFSVRWVWWVAVVGEAVQPGGPVNAALWLIVVCLAISWCFFLARRTHLTE